MIIKKTKPPITQRSFADPWGELAYLCKKTRYWLYARQMKGRAKYYLNRLRRVLRSLPENDLAIIRQEGWAIFHELSGDIDNAVVHRKEEIKLMERLHREAASPRYDDRCRAYMLQDRDSAALRERQAIVQTLLKTKVERKCRPVSTATY